MEVKKKMSTVIGKSTRDVDRIIKEEKKISLSLTAFELKQLLNKGIIKKEMKARAVFTAICGALKINPRLSGKISATRIIKERTGLTPSKLAHVILADEAYIKKLEK